MAVVGSSAISRSGSAAREKPRPSTRALSHAAAQLERVGLEVPPGLWDTDLVKQLDRPAPGFSRRHARVVYADRLDDLAADGMNRNSGTSWDPERSSRCAGPGTPESPCRWESSPTKSTAPPPSGGWNRTFQRSSLPGVCTMLSSARGTRLAAATLPDQADRSLCRQVEGHIVDRVHHPAVGMEIDRQIPDLQQPLRCHCPCSRHL